MMWFFSWATAAATLVTNHVYDLYGYYTRWPNISSEERSWFKEGELIVLHYMGFINLRHKVYDELEGHVRQNVFALLNIQ